MVSALGKQWLAYYALQENGRMNTPFMLVELLTYKPAMSVGNGCTFCNVIFPVH